MTQDRWGPLQWAAVAVVLLAWALRLQPLFHTPLHPDEALYGYWGLLIGRVQDPLLVSESIYKPPLLPYLVSLFELILGSSKVALRLAGLAGGVIAVPLTGALGLALFGDRWTALGASAALALSPFAVAFSGSAFPDPLMVALGLAGCVAAARGSARWAGFLAGMSFATKQTGLAWLPLVLGIAAIREGRAASQVGVLIGGYLIPVGLIVAWDGARVAQGADSFWSAGVVGYGGLRLIWPHELWPRLRAWMEAAACLFGSPAANAFLIIGSGVLLWTAVFRRPGIRSALSDLLLISFSLIYFWLHWLVAFPTWRRYLLPLLPVLAILLSRSFVELALWRAAGHRVWQRRALGILILVAVLVVPAGEAAAGRSPVAQERAPYAGVEQVTAFLSDLDEGSVVYHHWLGWHYRYALFDAPVYLAFWPTPAWLARDVQAFGGTVARYMAFPPWESAERVAQHLQEVGYRLDAVKELPQDGAGSFVIYRIEAVSR